MISGFKFTFFKTIAFIITDRHMHSKINRSTVKNFDKKTFFTSLLISGAIFIFATSCATLEKPLYSVPEQVALKSKTRTTSTKFLTGADNLASHLNLIRNKKIAILTNQTGMVQYEVPYTEYDSVKMEMQKSTRTVSEHIVDYLYSNPKINLVKIFAPEHGFRGEADAGETISDGKDRNTGLPIISLYGSNKKPTVEQLEGIDIMVFDLQDVGARFYTYISSLHYLMEACAENDIMVIILDRPNPNGNIVDGPILEKEYESFVGMHEIPVLHGMTIGEYALMINGENWLKGSLHCELKVVPCENYRREMAYDLPVRPSPNLPNAQSINLYPSLCFFEGTNVSVGRGTESQFQIYGSPNLTDYHFSFVPRPNKGAKDPIYNGKICCGVDLTKIPHVKKLELKWLLDAYSKTAEKSSFFTSYFTKLAGTKNLQNQIENGWSEKQIRDSWKPGLEIFREKRRQYLIYPDSFLMPN